HHPPAGYARDLLDLPRPAALAPPAVRVRLVTVLLEPVRDRLRGRDEPIEEGPGSQHTEEDRRRGESAEDGALLGGHEILDPLPPRARGGRRRGRGRRRFGDRGGGLTGD